MRSRNWRARSSETTLSCLPLTMRVGIEMLATAHDALLIQAPEHRIDEAVAIMQECMQKAAAVLTDGFNLRTTSDVNKTGERFIEERGRRGRGAVLVLHYVLVEVEVEARTHDEAVDVLAQGDGLDLL